MPVADLQFAFGYDLVSSFNSGTRVLGDFLIKGHLRGGALSPVRHHLGILQLEEIAAPLRLSLERFQRDETEFGDMLGATRWHGPEDAGIFVRLPIKPMFGSFGVPT